MYSMIHAVVPLFDSESFAFIGSADGELIVNCRKCRREAEAAIDTTKVALLVDLQGLSVEGRVQVQALGVCRPTRVDRQSLNSFDRRSGLGTIARFAA